MLNVILDKESKVVTLQPNGALTKEDFDEAVKIIDPFIEAEGNLNGVIIYTESFPGWENFSAMSRHFNFVKNNHKKIKKLAMVTNSKIGALGEHFSSHFVQAEIKSFAYDKIGEAREWILA